MLVSSESFRFDDPDDNHMELCVRRKALPATAGVSHVIFECVERARSARFYTEALGLKPAGEIGEESFLRIRQRPDDRRQASKRAIGANQAQRPCLPCRFQRQPARLRLHAGADSQTGRQIPRRFSRQRRAAAARRAQHLLFRSRYNYLQITASAKKTGR